MKAEFSVLMSVYKNDNPQHVSIALDSIINQSYLPAEIVIVVDGPISDTLNLLLDTYISEFSILKLIRLPVNKGLGDALRLGLLNCSYEFVARMDSDDISDYYRFEKQLVFLKANNNISIVGGTITEFLDDPNNIIGLRNCPLEHDDICKYMKKRCALNHVTVMFRKSDILTAGNYQEWFWNEDYFLWIRMMQASCRFANLDDVLVNVRVGKDMYARRGGYKYFLSEAKLQKYMYDNNLISMYQMSLNVLIRFVVQVLLPNSLRAFLFKTFFRSKLK